jgi:hypothetical protein
VSSFQQRGIVRKIIFEIEYPNGERKTAEFDNAGDVSHIAFRENSIASEDADAFNVSGSDWKQNPAMMIYRVNPETESDELGIPFCTHNGCKG